MEEIRIFKDMTQLAEYAVLKWAEISRAEVKTKGYFSVALSGGRTPGAFYKKLAGQKDFPWGQTHVFMVDERFVPYDSEENNYHMINMALLRHLDIPPKNIHPILTTETTAETSAERYEKDIISYCKSVRTNQPRFDLILLGIGEDGHTASLFPGAPTLKETGRLAVAVHSQDQSKRERITLTFPVINNAQHVYFMAEGAGKAAIIKEVVEVKNQRLPAVMVSPYEGKLVFLLDHSAASLIPGKMIQT